MEEEIKCDVCGKLFIAEIYVAQKLDENVSIVDARFTQCSDRCRKISKETDENVKNFCYNCKRVLTY
jgi:cytochrome oxidase Cu insertion factor (SCO1/SenC/PrrC family)